MLYKLGAVSYLNALPLIHYLEEKPVLAAPAPLARLLRIGEVDIATAPITALFENPHYTLVPGVCIGSNGPVRSVKLFFTQPGIDVHNVRSIYLDMESSTSIQLIKVLLQLKYGRNLNDIDFYRFPRVREYSSNRALPVGTDGANDSSTDTQMGGAGWRAVSPPDLNEAKLLIGDKAMKEVSEFPSIDLGEEWTSWTGLPFVYAAWISRHPEVSDRAIQELQEARDRGTGNIASVIPLDVTLPFQLVEDYLSNLVYTLGPKETEGMQLFQEYLIKLGLLSPSLPQLKYATR